MLDRHIILYDKNDTECDSMGIAVLDEHIKDDVIRETMNSNYTFEFMIEHEYANLLEGRSIIKAPTRQGDELFRVRLVERNIGDDGYSYVYCVQLFYCDMEDRLIEDLELNDVTGSTALTKMSQATDAPHNFTFYSDIDTVAYSYYYHKQFATALIGDLDESFVNLWGGELEVNKWDVKMHKHRGENRGVKVRYRDNMTGLNAAHDYSPVITRLYPMSADGITLDEKYVDSPLMDPNHPITQSMVFDYIYLTQDDGSDGGYLTEAEVKAAIKEMAQDMFSVGNIDKPESRYDVSLEELCRTREASHYAVLDYIFIGDTVEIQHEDWGVDVSTRLIEYTYQPKTDRYLSMTLGTVTGTFSNNTQRTQESILDKIETNKQTIQGKLDAAVEHLTSLIQGGVDGHVVITQNEILIMDTTDPATAVEVWRFNSGGIGYSNTGYNGPFIGLTKDGKLVVNEATAHTLSASLMNTGLLQSADGKSWWNFDNGHFSWADGAFTFDGEQFEFKINGTNIVDTLDKSFTILASHENQVIPVTSDGKALGYGDYLFEFTVIRNYSGAEAPCMVTKITPSSKITGVSYRQNENTCSMVVNKGTNLSANPDEYFDVELTILDYVLTKRITWCTVTQGADGNDGVPGTTYYTWIKYADDAQGNGISNSPNDKEYIGFAYNKTTPTESNKPSDYTWSLMKGNDGLKGEDGKDGNPNYTWIKYSDYSNGKDMYNTPNEFTGYIGIAVNKDTPTEGTDPSEYTWSKFRGEDGTDGQPGKTYYTWIKYADDAQGNGISNSPTNKDYIGFAYNKTSVTESNNPSDYTWSLIKGTDGVPGTNGKDGKTYYTWIKYSDNANGSNMYDIPKATTMYIGIAVNQTTSKEGTDPSKYTWSKFRGEDGASAPILYTWIKYADDAQGSGLSNTPDGKEYIGFAYNKTTATESDNPSDYMWSLIKGTDGQQGLPGKDGKTYYTWIKYSDNSNGSGMYDTPKSTTKYIGIAVNQTTSKEGTDPSKYVWSKFRGDDGVSGITYYTWIKYADDANGNGISNSPNGKEYIGFAYNKTTVTESNDPNDYIWSLIKGSDGIPGTNGKDGKTYYTWIKYSDNSNGSSMYDTPKDSTKYIGIAVNQTSATEGTDPSKYTWSKFRGNDGVAGPTHYTWIKYADDANGSGLSDNPSGKEYIGFAYNKTTATESAKPSDYTWSLIKGTDGIPGTNGKDGKTYYTWIKYSDNSNGSSMYDTPKSTTKYIGIAVNQTTSTEGTDPSKYTWSKFRGDDGVAGTTYYTWIKYADDASGNGLSDNPSGKEYIGFAYNKTSATESTKASDYTWSLIKGSDGQPGQPGSNGKTYYTWIKYSDNANGSGMYDTPKSSTKYIGIAVNQTTSTEGTDPSKYTWSKFRGDDGVPGIDGKDGKDGITQKHNLIKNSAFFNGSSGWKLESNTSLDYEFKYGDHPTVHIACSGITDKVKWYGISTTTNLAITELKEGVKYIFSYMYYTPNVKEFDGNLTMTSPSTSAFNLNIGSTDTDGTTTFYGPSQQISGLVEGMWTKVTGSFIPKKTGKVGRVKLGLAANGEVWATDFKLEENTEASDWCGTADESIGQDGVDGKPGHDAQTVSIVASSTVFKSTDGGVTFRPGSITLTPLYQNVTHSKWLYSTNNGTSWVTISNNGVSGISLNSQAVAISYDCQLFTNSITTVQFKVISTNASVYDVITITKISERADLNDTLATMEMTINQSSTAWQAAFKTSSANNLIKNSDAKFGTENWITNGGGIAVGKANAFPFYGSKEPYFRTSFPSGIKYAEDIILEPNTDYVYEGYVYVNGSIVPGNRTPLHFWCYTTNLGTVEACDIVDYRQNLVSGRFVKCYVHFKTKNVNSNIYFRPFIYSTSTVDVVGAKRLSLKKADRETEWCQHPNEVATSAVTISENGLKATHSEADTYTLMNARGNAIYDAETGEAIAWMSAKEQWTEAKFDYVFAKNIINCYTGDYTLYVDHSHTGASLGTAKNPFSSFADLKNHIPENTIITQDLHIIVRDPGFVIHEPLILWRISGNGYIRIELEGTLVIENDYHAIELIQINTWVWIRSGRTDVNSATTGAVLVARASNVDGTNCIRACDVSRLEVDYLTMVNTKGCALYLERTDAYTYCCDFGNSNRAVWLRYQSIYYSSSDCGSCSTFVRLNAGSKAYWGHAGSPIRPSGSCDADNGIFYSFANCATKASARYPGTSSPSAPSGTQNYTKSFDHTSLQTYQYAWTNWSTDGSCKQGSWGYGRRGGHMFFDISGIRSFLSGTVVDGNTITLTRANSGGLSGQSNVYLCGSTCSSASGTPTYSNRTHVGTLSWGEKKTFEIPLAIVQSLKSGTCSSLAVHVDSDAQNDYINITSASMTLKCKK